MTAGVLPSISTSPVRSASDSGRPCQSTAASVPGSLSTVASGRLARCPRASSSRPPATRDRKRVLAEPQLDGDVEPVGGSGVEQRLERDHEGVGAERGVARRERRLAAPAAELEDDRLEREAAVGELVDARARRRRELATAEEPGLLELAQALGEHVGAQVRQARAQVGEALRAEQQLAHDQQRPALADDIEGARDAAAVAVGPFRWPSAAVYRL